MFILNEERITWVLKEISKGFKLSPLEIIIYFLILLTIIFLFSWYYKREKQKSIKKRKEVSEKRLQKYIKELKLNQKEIETLQKISKLTKNPYDIPAIIEKKALFNKYAQKLLDKSPSLSRHISSLRVKIGHKADKIDQILHSTAEIPEYSQVHIIISNGETIRGNVSSVKQDYIVITKNNDKTRIISGKNVIIQYQNQSGIYYFPSKLINMKNREIFISHSEIAKRIQRRRFYRKRVHIPAIIKNESNDTTYFAIIEDLSGGGAKIKTKENIPPKNEIVIILPISENEKLTLKAKVISSEKGKIRVTFIDLHPALKDKIINFIFHNKRLS